MREARSIAARTAVIYAIIALVWIFASDYVAFLLPMPLHEVISTTKGFLFVIVTSAALYVLVARAHTRLNQEAIRTRSAERVLGQVVETVPVGVLLVGDDGVITFANPSAERLLGLARSESVGRTLDELCCRDGTTQSGEVGELLRTGAFDGMELSRGPGQPALAVIARAAQIDESVPGSGWVVALADVTESHRANERTQRLVEGYGFLAEALVLSGRASDTPALLERVCELAADTGGFSAAWALLRTDEGGFEHAGRVGFGEAALEVLEGVRTRALVEDGPMLQELAAGQIVASNDIARDPASPWYTLSTSEGFHSVAAFAVLGPLGMVATVTLFAPKPGWFDAPEIDILRTLQSALGFAADRIALERRRLEAEEALGRSEQVYRNLFERLPQPMWVFEKRGLAFLAVNDAAVAKYGYSRAEFLAMTILDIRPRDEVPSVLGRISAVHDQDGFEDAGVWTHRDKSGRTFPVHIYAHPIVWEGKDAQIILASEVARVE